MKTTVLTIALAITTAFVLSQPAAIAKTHKGGAKNTAGKMQHKKHWYKR